MFTSTLATKAQAAYQHGRMDYRAGWPRDPQTPLRVYRDLDEYQQKIISDSWVEGWDMEKWKEEGIAV